MASWPQGIPFEHITAGANTHVLTVMKVELNVTRAKFTAIAIPNIFPIVPDAEEALEGDINENDTGNFSSLGSLRTPRISLKVNMTPEWDFLAQPCRSREHIRPQNGPLATS